MEGRQGALLQPGGCHEPIHNCRGPRDSRCGCGWARGMARHPRTALTTNPALCRDLGTSLGRLQVLWLARCGLTDLDGIGSFLALKVGLRCPGPGRAPRQAGAEVPVPPQELYVSYNNVSDLSPLCLLEQLEVLDLEGNDVEDLGQVRYLQLCPRLAVLTLEGNLVCLRPSPSGKVRARAGGEALCGSGP